MDRSIWRQLAAAWVSAQTAEDRENTARTAEALFQRALGSRREERSLADLLRESMNEEDDGDEEG